MLKDTLTQLFHNTALKMRKRKRSSKARGFYKLKTEISTSWYFQYMEVWVTNAVRFIIDSQTYYLKQETYHLR